MRYISTNSDGSVEVWGCLPIAIVDLFGVRYEIVGVRRPRGRCVLDFRNVERREALSVDVGDDTTDPADLAADAIPGFAIVHADFDGDIRAKLHPDNRGRIASHRQTTAEELIASGLHQKDKHGHLVADHTFREAWEDTGKLSVNMPKARTIHLDRIRAARDAKLIELDAEWMKATGQRRPTAAETVETKRQALRDLPQTVQPQLDAAATPAELKAIWPTIIGDP